MNVNEDGALVPSFFLFWLKALDRGKIRIEAMRKEVPVMDLVYLDSDILGDSYEDVYKRQTLKKGMV